jgi:LuxR family maltose regulon positive regulatory protein
LQALGDAAGALGAIQEAMRVWQQYNVTRMWSVPPVATYQARLWLAQGDVASAARWAQEQGLRADGELCYQREVDYLTRNIYGKLGVNSRTQAVARARALGILSST